LWLSVPVKFPSESTEPEKKRAQVRKGGGGRRAVSVRKVEPKGKQRHETRGKQDKNKHRMEQTVRKKDS
jgi:hypothetical protein